MEIVITGRELLIGLIIGVLVYLLESWLFARRRRSAEPGDKLAREVAALRAEVAALTQRLDARNDQSGDDVPTASETAMTAYDHAMQYARKGLDAPEIASRCGISRDEAILIVAMHGRSDRR